MFAQFRPALVLMILMTVLTGIVYPLLVTAVSQVGMPERANGSLIVRDGKAGSIVLYACQGAGKPEEVGRLDLPAGKSN